MTDFSHDDDRQEMEPEPVALTAEQAQLLRQKLGHITPGRVLVVQALVGVLLVLGLGFAWPDAVVVQSAGYGVLAAWLPAALFAYGLLRQRHIPHAGVAVVGMMVWWGVKVASAVLLLLSAPAVLGQVNWLALLAGFVVTMKTAWLAVLWLKSPGIAR